MGPIVEIWVILALIMGTTGLVFALLSYDAFRTTSFGSGVLGLALLLLVLVLYHAVYFLTDGQAPGLRMIESVVYVGVAAISLWLVYTHPGRARTGGRS